jgi:hypothetical protein
MEELVMELESLRRQVWGQTSYTSIYTYNDARVRRNCPPIDLPVIPVLTNRTTGLAHFHLSQVSGIRRFLDPCRRRQYFSSKRRLPITLLLRVMKNKTWILNNTQLKSQNSHIHWRQTQSIIVAIKILDTVIVSCWKTSQNFGSWIFRPLWGFYPETTENDCHNEHSGHKLSSESCKRVESISARDQQKGKAVPLQACSGPEGSRKLRFADFMTKAQDGGKVVSLAHRPPLSPGNTPGTHFC